MMRVLVEIHPFGHSEMKRTIAEIEIANMGGPDDAANYRVTACLDDQPTKTLEVRGHDRSKGWLPLVQRVLERLGVVR